jgi:hypothetical protein
VRYYIKNPHNGQIDGPLEVDELNARIAELSIGPDWLATSDIGDAFEHVKRAPKGDWFSLSRISDVRIARPNNFDVEKPGLEIISFSVALVVMAAGALLLLGGFFYDVMASGNPYQEPTIETSMRAARHADTVSTIFWLGVGVFSFGSSFAIIRFKRPVSALVSVSVPFVGFLLGLDVLSIPDPDSGHMGLLRTYQFAGIMLLASVTGGIAAVIALLRGEKYWVLASIGLILNCWPILYFFVLRGR